MTATNSAQYGVARRVLLYHSGNKVCMTPGPLSSRAWLLRRWPPPPRFPTGAFPVRERIFDK
eukprot:gene8148-1943_t